LLLLEEGTDASFDLTLLFGPHHRLRVLHKVAEG
jgi:hypothetical protein